MITVDDEWQKFCENEEVFIPENSPATNEKDQKFPKCGDIYISTKTKIAYLNMKIPLQEIFWKIPVIKYFVPEEGVIKKQIKINSDTAIAVTELDKRLSIIENCSVDIISQIDNPNARKIKYKDVRKINIGICKKDLTTYRKKKRGAFYNCFVILLRLKYKGKFKEIHVKVFNTGKLEIPGIQYDDLLTLTLDRLVSLLSPYFTEKLSYNADDIQTVLINSNFDCRFEIDRDKFYDILKYKYNLNVTYDPCSYPGIQCKYYHRPLKQHLQKKPGVCSCEVQCGKKNRNKKHKNKDTKDDCLEISFMIFRTGSILIVGHCEEDILYLIYEFLKVILKDEYNNIKTISNVPRKKKSKKKLHKKTIILTI
jgi:TATA-box binding protein (TBP) (component of TFIID and TFIIIB)